MGRMWIAPPGTSLLLSVRLVPVVAAERLPTLTVVAAKAVCAGVGALGVDAAVEEPDHVLAGGRKGAGVRPAAGEGPGTPGGGLKVSPPAGRRSERGGSPPPPL